jgi:predicted DNA-binding protein YlxM (UPF0122 family)
MSEYLKIAAASEIAGISVQSTYDAIRRGALQSKKIEGKIFTTRTWINDYMSSRNNRQRIHFQGKPCYDYLLGEWSVKMVAHHLQTTIQSVHYMLRHGHLRSFRRGSYHVIPRESVELMLAKNIYVKQERTKKIA